MDIASSVNLPPTSGTSGSDLVAAAAWLDLMHGTSEGYLNICSTKDWAGQFFQPHEIPEAVQYIELLDRAKVEGIYLRTTTLATVPPPGKRGSIELSYMLPGFALDLDIAGPGHKNTGLPTDVETAMAIIENTGLPTPTCWVHSGGGLYPWWLLNEPLDVSLKSNRDLAEKVFAGLEVLAATRSEQMGFTFGTGVRDLARVLRIPGTVNRKAGLSRGCRMLEPASYEFYDIHTLDAVVVDLLDALPTKKVEIPRAEAKPIRVTNDISPGDAMELAWDWADILVPAGWDYMYNRGHVRYWRRPGKTDPGHSATTGRASDRDRLFVMSTDATPFQSSFDPSVGPYTKFAAYTLLNHNGDFSAATRALRALGFGGDRPQQYQPSDLPSLVRPADQRSAPAQVQVAGAEQGKAVEQVSTVSSPAVQTGIVVDHEVLPQVPQVDIGSERDTIISVTSIINKGFIPDVYVRDGELVHVQPKSGAEGGVVVAPLNADRLNNLVAHNVRTFKLDSKGNVRDATPSITSLRAVVTSNYWPGVPALAGVVGAPTIRPDGSLIEDTGYDKATHLYHQPSVKVDKLPTEITDEQVRASREFVFSKVFGEFCWSTPGDFANYMALLISPMLRPYVKSTTPFGMITATTRGSGKTNLSDAIGMIYGQSSQVWPHRPEELQKKITSVLIGNASPVVVFDNLMEGTCIRSEVLAGLVTKDGWDDRMLGASKNVEARNDRLWLATGNGLTVGGDMGSRTVMVRLDPRMERPELRTFEMGQFSDWIRVEANRAALLYHLLILVQHWMQAGGQADERHTMRGFTRWAQIMGGFLAHHGLTGFLGNTDELAARDTDEEEWATFLAKWFEIFGPSKKTSKELHASAQIDFVMGTSMDRWARCFITDEQGNVPTTKSLAMMLFGKLDRIYGSYTLRRDRSTVHNVTMWWVERADDDDETDDAVREVAAAAG